MRIDSRTVMYFIGIAALFFLFSRILSGGGLGGLNVVQLFFTAIGFLVAIDIHECAHAVAADRLGDPTPRYQGRITLNPLKHLDPFGTLMIFMAGFGWGRAVVINPSRIASGRAGLALVSVAGVLANLATAVVAALLLHSPIFASGGPLSLFWTPLLLAIAQVSIILAVFNFLVPLPPLDGYNFLVNVLPLRWAWQLRRIEPYGPIILLLIIIGSQMGILFINPLNYLVGYPTMWLRGALGVG